MAHRISDSELLAQIVGFDTTSRKTNLPLVETICDYLDRPGVEIHSQLSPDGERANLIVVAGSEAGGDAGLTLCGHLDTVPAVEPDWQSDPFTMFEQNGVYIGRGVCDMKGFVALAINTFLDTDPNRLAQPLALLLTYDEEVGTKGAQQLVDRGLNGLTLPTSTIVGEPTSLRVVRMHKGHFQARLTVRGKPAHSGYPHLGRNAIEPAARAVVALSHLRDDLMNERPAHSEHFPEAPFVTLNVGQIEGGTVANIIPDRCAIELGVRPLPGMRMEEILSRVREVVENALVEEEFSFELVNESPALLLAEDASIYRQLCRQTGQADSISVSYATDAGWLERLGLDCVIFGPGSMDTAHKPNESLPVEQFSRAAELLREVVDRRCVDPVS